MTDAKDRRIDTYSKGMRQRMRVAAALVHDPAVLLLDEPFNGMDPRQRMHMMELLHDMGDQGRTVLFSSHILEEVEQVSGTVQVIVAGRLAASGDYRTIRRLMTNRPHVFTDRLHDDRRLAVALMAEESVAGVELDPNGGPHRAGRRLRHLHPGAAQGRAGTASGSSGWCPPTSRWRASSPTWLVSDDRCVQPDDRPDHAAGAVRPPAVPAAAAAAAAAGRPGRAGQLRSAPSRRTGPSR